MGTVTGLGVCRYLPVEACITYISAVTVLSLVGISQAQYHYWRYEIHTHKDDVEKSTKESEKIAYDKGKSQLDYEKLVGERDFFQSKLHGEVMHQQFQRWEEGLKMEKVAWINQWKPQYYWAKSKAERYYPGVMTVEIDAAKYNLTKAEKLGQKIAEAKPEVITIPLDDWLKTEEEVTTWEDYLKLRSSAERAIQDLDDAFGRYKAKTDQEIENRDRRIKELEKQLALQRIDPDHLDLPGQFPDGYERPEDIQGDNIVRREAPIDDLPRLISETKHDCENQPCGRMWYSKSQSMKQSKRDGAPSEVSEVIHNIYSTPLDFDFHDDPRTRRQKRRQRRDAGIFVRLASTYGGDVKSFNRIADLSLMDTHTIRKQLEKGAAQELATGDWECLDLDGDDGGDMGLRTSVIFSRDHAKTQGDAGPILRKCEKRKKARTELGLSPSYHAS